MSIIVELNHRKQALAYLFFPIQRQILSSYHSRNLLDELSNHNMFWFGFFQIKTLAFQKKEAIS